MQKQLLFSSSPKAGKNLCLRFKEGITSYSWEGQFSWSIEARVDWMRTTPVREGDPFIQSAN